MSNTDDDAMLGLASLESLNATAADIELIFTPPVTEAVAKRADAWLRSTDEVGHVTFDRYHRFVVRPNFLREQRATADGREHETFIDLVRIAAGMFEMGSDECEDEKPVHHVHITKQFLMGRTPVTQREWVTVMGTNPWGDHKYEESMRQWNDMRCQDPYGYGPDTAVACVTWYQAVEFCDRLTELERSLGRLGAGRRYRLPTEAEWEYACRAGTKTHFSCGNDEMQLRSFAAVRSLMDVKLFPNVGAKSPNPWGLCDMHGTVEEWCSDWWAADWYGRSPGVNPQGPDCGSDRVARGGGIDSVPERCRSAARRSIPPSSRDYRVGFRVLCEIE